jgi:hypothetical protein
MLPWDFLNLVENFSLGKTFTIIFSKEEENYEKRVFVGAIVCWGAWMSSIYFRLKEKRGFGIVSSYVWFSIIMERILVLELSQHLPRFRLKFYVTSLFYLYPRGLKEKSLNDVNHLVCSN